MRSHAKHGVCLSRRRPGPQQRRGEEQGKAGAVIALTPPRNILLSACREAPRFSLHPHAFSHPGRQADCRWRNRWAGVRGVQAGEGGASCELQRTIATAPSCGIGLGPRPYREFAPAASAVGGCARDGAARRFSRGAALPKWGARCRRCAPAICRRCGAGVSRGAGSAACGACFCSLGASAARSTGYHTHR